MVSATVNVVRYTALASGALFGWYHGRTLQAAHDQHKIEMAAHHREKLIKDAKDAWKRRLDTNDSSVVSDPEDPHFDLEKLIAQYEKLS